MKMWGSRFQTKGEASRQSLRQKWVWICCKNGKKGHGWDGEQQEISYETVTWANHGNLAGHGKMPIGHWVYNSGKSFFNLFAHFFKKVWFSYYCPD